MVLLGSVCLGFVDEFEILFCSPPVPAERGSDSCAVIGSGGSVSVATISHLHVCIYPRSKALQPYTYITLLPIKNSQKSCTKVSCLVLNSHKLMEIETMTMMTPYGVIGWENIMYTHTLMGFLYGAFNPLPTIRNS